MGYLGTPPQSGFITTAKQRVTSSTNNYVDLDHSISSIADVIVFVNFVKQDTTNLTLTTSTRITLGGTLVSSDVVEIHYLGKAVNTQTPGTGTVTNDMLAGSIANSKLANSSISINGSSVSLGGSITGIGTDNVPAFFAYSNNSYQAVNTFTWTSVNVSNEAFDTANAFNTSDYKFTPQVAGKYMFFGNIGTDGNWGTLGRLRISKNDNSVGGDEVRNVNKVEGDEGIHASGMLTLNGSTDYVRMQVYHESSMSSVNMKNQSILNYFGGFLVTTT